MTLKSVLIVCKFSYVLQKLILALGFILNIPPETGYYKGFGVHGLLLFMLFQ